MRWLYGLGLTYLALCAVLLGSVRPPADTAVTPRPAAAPAPQPAQQALPASAGEWFARIKPFCNPVEVETQLRFRPPPRSADGSAYAAACYALAGKLDKARARLDALPSAQRPAAAGVVYELGRAVSGTGDSMSAGPLMCLVVDYQPENTFALAEAGVWEYLSGRLESSERHLRRFQELYDRDDDYRRSILAVLEHLHDPSYHAVARQPFWMRELER